MRSTEEIAFDIFDFEYYLLQTNDKLVSKEEAFDHYLNEGWKSNLIPTPLFNPEYYFFHRVDVKQANINPFMHFINSGEKEGSNPHPLVSTKLIKKQVTEKNKSILECLLAKDSPTYYVHKLFDNNLYLEKIIDKIELHPLVHYLKFGWKKGFNVCKIFDSNFYTINYNYKEADYLDPFSHYLSIGWIEQNNPHPMFDNFFYYNSYINTPDNKISSLEHYIENVETRTDLLPHWTLSTLAYEALNLTRDQLFTLPEIVNKNFKMFISSKDKNRQIFDSRFLELYSSINLNQSLVRRSYPTRVIFLIHSAKRTGVPLIMLRLASIMKINFDVDCFFILLEGGALEKDFKNLDHTVNCEEYLNGAKINNFAAILKAINHRGLTLAISGSIAGTNLTKLCSSLKIPTFLLLHEFYSESKNKNLFYSAFKAVNKVFVPSKLLIEDLNENMSDFLKTKFKFSIKKTALLNKNLLNFYVKNDYKKLLGYDDNYKIVIGVGERSERKGYDLFLKLANSYIEKNKKTVFIWVGGKYLEGNPFENLEIKLGNNLILTDEVKNVETYLRASDVFISSSRFDPYPCVVKEALATKTPVIIFDKYNGTIDLVEKGCGLVVPYLNLELMEEALDKLLNNEALVSKLGENANSVLKEEDDMLQYTNSLLEAISENLNLSQIGNLKLKEVELDSNKVFLATSDWCLSGVNTVIEVLTKKLIEIGYDAKILFTTNTPFSSSIKPDCPYVILDNNYSVDSEDDRVVNARVFFENHRGSNLILTYDHIFNNIAKILPNDIKVIALIQSDDPDYYERVSLSGRYWDIIVAVSNKIKKEILSINPGFDKKVFVIGNSSVLDEDIAIRENKEQIDTINLVYAGRIVQHQKNICEFIKIVNLLEARNIEYKFNIYGDDHGTGILEFLQNEWELQIANKKIIFHDRTDSNSIKKAFRENDLFLLTSNFEGFPLALVEAMASGCIPISYKIESGIPEIINHKKNGFIVESRTPEELVDYIVEFKNNCSLRQSLLENCNTSVTKNLNATNMLIKYNFILNKLRETKIKRPSEYTLNKTYKDIYKLAQND